MLPSASLVSPLPFTSSRSRQQREIPPPLPTPLHPQRKPVCDTRVDTAFPAALFTITPHLDPGFLCHPGYILHHLVSNRSLVLVYQFRCWMIFPSVWLSVGRKTFVVYARGRLHCLLGVASLEWRSTVDTRHVFASRFPSPTAYL